MKKGRQRDQKSAPREVDPRARFLQQQLALDAKIRWSCNLSGRCCFGTPVLINPHDVWRLVHSSEVVVSTGLALTAHYFEARDYHHDGNFEPLLHIYLGEHSQMPVGSIYRRRINQEVEVCPFLVSEVESRTSTEPKYRLTVDQKPMMVCGVHDGRPTICRAYPFGRGRMAAEAASFRMSTGTDVYFDVRSDGGCKSCYVDSDKGEERTLGDFFEQSGAMDGFKMSNLWFEVLDHLLEIPAECGNIRMLVGVFAYDFDRGWVTYLTDREEVVRRRARSFPEHMERVRRLVDALVKKSAFDVVDALRAFMPFEKAQELVRRGFVEN